MTHRRMEEEKEEKKELKSDIQWKRHTLETVNDTSSCDHDFIMRGVRLAECRICGLGVFINGIKDYERLTSRRG